MAPYLAPAAQLHERVGAPLSGRPVVVLAGQHESIQSRLDDRSALGIEETVDPNQPVGGLAQVKISPLMGAIGFRQRAGRVDLVLKILGHRGELAPVQPRCRLE